jgi:hypothetical protein
MIEWTKKPSHAIVPLIGQISQKIRKSKLNTNDLLLPDESIQQ